MGRREVSGDRAVASTPGRRDVSGERAGRREPSPGSKTTVARSRDPVPQATAGRAAVVRQSSQTKVRREASVTRRQETETVKKEPVVKREASLTRVGSRREASPSLTRPQRLGARTTSPNTSSSSMRGVGRTPSTTRATPTSRPTSRSSSFTKAEVKSASVVRSGLATLPKEATGRSRSSGDYVTVLEIGSSEVSARSRSAGVRGASKITVTSAAPPPETRRRAPVSRSSSLKKVGSKGSLKEGDAVTGPVSVQVKQVRSRSWSRTVLSRQPPSPCLPLEGKPARKQSIKIGPGGEAREEGLGAGQPECTCFI